MEFFVKVRSRQSGPARVPGLARLHINRPLVHVVKILKKIGVTGKIWEKAGVKLLRDLTEKSVNFSTLATSNIRLLLVFGEEDQ